jgi:FkbM family methyltransferase
MIAKVRAMLRRKLVRRLNAPDIPMALERLAQRGFSPELIFDVGASRGDFAASVLAVWPLARVACFEPLRHGEAQITKLKGAFPSIDLHKTLVGATTKAAVELHVAETSTSLLRDVDTDKYPVEVFPQTTVDITVRDSYAGRAPDLLKLDVQGYELEVLKGAVDSLSRTHAILAEINLLDIHEEVPLLDEMIAWLSQRGFIAYDICGLTRRPLDDALWQTDIIFVQKDDPLRHDKRWSSTQGHRASAT